MDKNIVFTIRTAYSEETYFLTVNNSHSIESQIDDALADICFCDDYVIASWKEVSQEYVKARERLMKEYKRLFNESVEDALMGRKYATLEAIARDIKWRMS